MTQNRTGALNGIRVLDLGRNFPKPNSHQLAGNTGENDFLGGPIHSVLEDFAFGHFAGKCDADTVNAPA